MIPDCASLLYIDDQLKSILVIWEGGEKDLLVSSVVSEETSLIVSKSVWIETSETSNEQDKVYNELNQLEHLWLPD